MMVRLGDYINITNGYAFKSSSYVDSGVRVMRITNVQKGKITDDSPKYYPQETQKELGKYLISEGEILMSLTGNVGRVGRLPASYLPAYVNQRVCRINTSNPALSDDYLYYILNSDVFERDAINNSAGVAQLNLSTKWIEDYQIPLPPLEEQKQIAAILDAADELRQKDKALIAKYDELTQSLFLDMFGDPVTNPKGWKKQKLGDISIKVTDGEHGTVKRVEDGKLYLMARNVGNDGISYSEVSYIHQDDHDKIFKRCNPEEGDLLLVCVGATIGRCCLVPQGDEFSLARSVALIKPDRSLLNSAFLLSHFKYKGFQNQILNRRNTSAQAGLYTGQIKQLELIHPPIDLQNQFAESIKIIESQKRIAQESLLKTEDLFNNLLQKAFKGELTG